MKTYAEYKSIVDDSLADLFKKIKAKDDYSLSPLVSAMEYSVVGGGKRLRPVLLLMSAETFGGTIQNVMPLALALELIQGYSLVHDDMPCMDDDELRRGKPTTHKAFGEAIGLLAGDGLLNLAAEVATEGALISNDIKNYCKALNYLFSMSGFNGMAGGQGVDVYTEKYNPEAITEDVVLAMYEGKTSALFKAAVCCGAIASGANENQVKTLETFAKYLGIAFQLKDDLLDVTSSKEKLGKDIGSDLKNEKKNIFSFKTTEQVDDLCKEYTRLAVESLSKVKVDCSALLELTLNLLDREY